MPAINRSSNQQRFTPSRFNALSAALACTAVTFMFGGNCPASAQAANGGDASNTIPGMGGAGVDGAGSGGGGGTSSFPPSTNAGGGGGAGGSSGSGGAGGDSSGSGGSGGNGGAVGGTGSVIGADKTGGSGAGGSLGFGAGGGGGGGGGGIGFWITGSPTLTNAFNLTGGAGGDKGASMAGGFGHPGGGGAGVGGSGFELTNTGNITGGAGGVGGGAGGAGVASGTFTLVNAGTIKGGAGGTGGTGGAGVDIFKGAGVSSLNNSALGTITGGNSPNGDAGPGIQVQAGGSVVDLLNYGSILPGTGAGLQYYGISNNGTITTLSNAQGGGAPLTYTGKLPTNYNIIVSSTSAYGKLAATSITGTTTFSVLPSSTLATNTYTAVLSGFDASKLSGTLTGTLGGFTWTLSPESGASTTWDLIVCATGACGGGGGGGSGGAGSGSSGGTTSLTNINQGGSFGLSTIGVTTNPVFAGGTLTLTPGASTSQTFTVTAAGGTIATPVGSTASMTGGLTGTGSIVINGGGTLNLGGTNTYKGGTTIDGGTTV